MSSNLLSLLGLLSLSAVFSVIADVLGKKWVTNHDWKYFAIAIILIVFSGVFFIYSLKYEKLGIVSVAWDSVTTIAYCGLFCFQGKLERHPALCGRSYFYRHVFIV